MMGPLLDATLAGAVPASGEGPGLRWRGLAEGLLALVPQHPAAPLVLLSAGIHGDETAPIEVLDALVGDLQAGRLPLAVRLLVVLGNPAAMRAGERYLDEDMNRLFAGRRQGREDTREARRAALIEATVANFMADSCGPAAGAATVPAAGNVPATPPVHYDLHTAIRGSRFERFGLLPFNAGQRYPREQLDWLAAAGLEALLINHAPAGTFAYHSAATCGAASCTLELGKVRAFGDNDLSRFAGIDRALRALVSGQAVSPAGTALAATSAPAPAPRPRVFRVVGELAKSSEAFELLLADDVDNFTAFPRGTLIARDGDYTYVVQHAEERIVFPNRTVKPGLRAGMMVVEVPAASLWE